MNDKSAGILEFPKVLQRLAQHTTFSASYEMALELEPVADLEAARDLQRETGEARALLEAKPNLSMGGIHDVRAAVLSTERGFVLDGSTLLDLLSTLRRTSYLRRTLLRLRGQFPLLADHVDVMEDCEALQDEIQRILDETGEVKDTASKKLATVRREVRIAFDRLQTKINNIATSSTNTPYLQETIVTQRNGRYVIPLKSEFKGRIPGVVHDQSSSGATLFIEPLSTVELNNTYRELQIEEENEVRRILAELSERVSHEAHHIVTTIDTLAYFDLVLARAKFADALDAHEPELLVFRDDIPNLNHPGGTIRLYQARHPLLPPHEVVPIDVDLDDDTYVLVITGPNTGGKTVALKTVGLMVLMSQCGLHLPTGPECQLSVFEDVYADIGDEQSIEQSLSTFSAHMTNIIDILDKANHRSLVILDELGAGTDPTEGSALARALLVHLLENSITTLVTTHHPELKAFSFNTPGARNASVEFDIETLAPTYRLVVGLPGRSNALAIATRLGLPAHIIETARSMIGTEDMEIDDLLDEIQKSRDEIRATLERANQTELENRQLRQDLQMRLDAIDDERRTRLLETQQQAEADLEELRREIRRLRRQLEAAGQPLDAIRNLQKAADEIQSNDYIEVPHVVIEDEEDQQPSGFRLGETVWVPSLNSEGQIAEITEDEVEVMVGRLRIRTKPGELQRRSRKARKEASRSERRNKVSTDAVSTTTPRPASPGLELDLRGQTVEDALPAVDAYLDSAYLAGLPFVRIIHGKGTGTLRDAVRNALSRHPLVSKHSSGNHKEGGSGVTIVYLVKQA